MGTLGDKNKPKISQTISQKYFCEICDYRTSKKSNYATHIESNKHRMVTNDYKKGQKSAEIQPTAENYFNEKFVCLCGKEYQHRQGLWRHKKTCNNEKKVAVVDNTKDELIKYLMKENSDLRKGQDEIKELILEIVKNGTHNTTNNTITNTNSHNKAFNLNFFLNETCKNAMNITDFVDNIKLQLTDLMEVGELGYIEGISKIIVKNLNNIDETLRPIHCTDKKRETFYVKDENQWAKEDEDKKKIKKVIKTIANKNIKLLPQFREKYPDYSNSSLKISDTYDKMVIEAMGGPGDNEIDKEDKIIKNISKATTIGNKGL